MLSRWILVAAVALALPVALPRTAAAVAVSAGTGSGLAGQTVDIAISTASLTGLGVVSYQFQVTYTASVVTAVDVIEAGTLTAGWGDATFNVTSGRIAVSHAGTTALTGAGTLLILRFQIDPSQLLATSSGLTLGSFLFNEGNPVATTTNGLITVNATPVITVAPNTGEIIKNQTLQFTVSGGVTPPVTWSTTNPAVASISATGLLTGLAPGVVRVNALDNAGRSDQSNGDILIRGMGVTVAPGTAVQGNTGSVNVTVTDLTGMGITSGQIDIGFTSTLVSVVSVTPGAMLSGTTVVSGSTPSSVSVNFAGTTPLSGSGQLFQITFLAATTSSGTSNLTLTQALFNETLVAFKTNGSFLVSPRATITVAPDNATVLAGATRQFTVSGGATSPVGWSVLNPAVASIDGSGLLTGLSGGTTQVRAVDFVGATDDNNSVEVYDFQLNVPIVIAPPGATIQVPLVADRVVGGFNIRSLQYTLVHSASAVSGASVSGGVASAWGAATVNGLSDRVVVASAGSSALGSGSTTLQTVSLTVSPSATVGSNIPLTLTGFTANEGSPRALVVNGELRVRTGAGVDGPSPAVLSLGPATPNPWRGTMRMDFVIPGGGASDTPVRLAVFGPDGRLRKVLIDRAFAPGRYNVRWSGNDERDRPTSPGVYFVRLEAMGRSVERKVVRIE